jgi:integrase
MKTGKSTGKDHRVPLTDEVMALLRALPRKKDCPYIFSRPNGKTLQDDAMRKVRDSMDYSHITIHGFRSTFKDWANETTGHANDVIEMALAHTVGNKVEQAYRRGDLIEKRRNIMTDWAHYCTRPPVKGDNVVGIRSAS